MGLCITKYSYSVNREVWDNLSVSSKHYILNIISSITFEDFVTFESYFKGDIESVMRVVSNDLSRTVR